MTCSHCGHTITDTERTGKTLLGVLCELCLEKADQCAPVEDMPYENDEYPDYVATL